MINPIKNDNFNDSTIENEENTIISNKSEQTKKKIKSGDNELIEDALNADKGYKDEEDNIEYSPAKEVEVETLILKEESPKINKKETIINLIKQGKSNSEIHKETGFKKKDIRKIRHEIND